MTPGSPPCCGRGATAERGSDGRSRELARRLRILSGRSVDPSTATRPDPPQNLLPCRNLRKVAVGSGKPPQPLLLHRSFPPSAATSTYPPQLGLFRRNLQFFTAASRRSPQLGGRLRWISLFCGRMSLSTAEWPRSPQPKVVHRRIAIPAATFRCLPQPADFHRNSRKPPVQAAFRRASRSSAFLVAAPRTVLSKMHQTRRPAPACSWSREARASR